MSLVVEDGEPIRVVEVPVREHPESVLDHGPSGWSSVTLLVQDEHDPEVDDVGFGVMQVDGVHQLDRGHGDRSSNASTGTVSDWNGDETGDSKRIVVRERVD